MTCPQVSVKSMSLMSVRRQLNVCQPRAGAEPVLEGSAFAITGIAQEGSPEVLWERLLDSGTSPWSGHMWSNHFQKEEGVGADNNPPLAVALLRLGAPPPARTGRSSRAGKANKSSSDPTGNLTISVHTPPNPIGRQLLGNPKMDARQGSRMGVIVTGCAVPPLPSFIWRRPLPVEQTFWSEALSSPESCALIMCRTSRGKMSGGAHMGSA